MQYDVQTPAEYLAALESDWRREKLLQIRSFILELAPQTIEGIQYKMLSYADAKGVFFHLNAQKNYVSLYVGDAKKVDPNGDLLQGLEVGKGCIRIKKKVVLADSSIQAFIARAIELRQKGEDIGC